MITKDGEFLVSMAMRRHDLESLDRAVLDLIELATTTGGPNDADKPSGPRLVP